MALFGYDSTFMERVTVLEQCLAPSVREEALNLKKEDNNKEEEMSFHPQTSWIRDGFCSSSLN